MQRNSLFLAGLTLAISLISLVFSQTSQAADTGSDCGHFHLQISNVTKEACILISQKVIHGNLISSPPASIMPNDSKVFDMEQTVYGPSVMLTYRCGNEDITLSSQQNFCLLEAGNITGEILSPRPRDINASYMALSGSFFWAKPGNINWQIQDIK